MTAMQESDIAAVVQAVLRELGQWPAAPDAASTPAPYAASTPGTAGAAGNAPEAPDTLPALCDLGSDPARQHCGVAQPRHPGVVPGTTFNVHQPPWVLPFFSVID